MALFRKKVHVGSGMRLMLRTLLTRDIDRAFSEVAAGDLLTPEDISRLKTELRSFDVAICQALFLEHFGWGSTDTVQTLSRKFGMALHYALQDSGVADESVEARTEELTEQSLSYLSSLKSVPADKLDNAGLFFWYCQEFAERIIPAVDAQSEVAQERRLQIFEIARQNYMVAKQAFDSLTGDYRFLLD